MKKSKFSSSKQAQKPSALLAKMLTGKQPPTPVAPQPVSLEDLHNRAFALHSAGQLEEAKKIYLQILTVEPNNANTLGMLSLVYLKQNKLNESLLYSNKAIEINPSDATLYSNRGVIFKELNQHEDAIKNYDTAIALKPDYARAYSNRGASLISLKKYDAAIASCCASIALQPDDAEAHYNHGTALSELKKYELAIKSYNQAIVLNPNYFGSYINCCNTFIKLKKYQESMSYCNQAILLNPNYAEAYFNRGVILSELKQYKEAIKNYDKAVSLNSRIDFIQSNRLHAKAKICKWENFDSELQAMIQSIQIDNIPSDCFSILSLEDSSNLHRQVVNTYIHNKHPFNPELGTIHQRSANNLPSKIRIGYFSSDFRHHAVAQLIAELFDHHDKNRFEIIAFAFGVESNDSMRQRLIGAFDQFIDVRNSSDKEVAQLARNLGIDIAVDLNGFTADNRLGIFAYRAAPIQVSYLGYPGTLGADYIDYIIADKILIPESAQQFYSEKIVYLPHSYQVNDRKRVISDKVFTREELGLPDTGFVFCCFNNNFKIMPNIFYSWMRILQKVPHSVLWLFEDNPTAAHNLRKEASLRGVDSNRLVFATRMPNFEHLARHRAADLFIDTLPYNAHTTASDALWAGLPVLTRMGESFASRVAGSLLHAIHLPELITTTAEEFEAKAVELALNPEKLHAIREKLHQNRLTTPLFDSELFTRHIENAYTQMVQRYHEGLPPEHIQVHPQFPLDDLIQKALMLHQSGKVTEAEQLYRKILALEPAHATALGLLGAACLQQNKLDEALQYLDQAIAINPNDANCYSNRGITFRRLNKYHEALENYNHAIELDSNNANAYSNSGNIFIELGQYELAIDRFNNAIRINPIDANYYSNRGLSFVRIKNYTDALNDFNHAIKLAPDFAEAYFNIGLIFCEIKKYGISIQYYNQAIAFNKKYVEAYNNCGLALNEIKQYELAIENYNKAIFLKSDYLDSYSNKSISLLTLGDFTNGLPLYEYRWQSGELKKFQRNFEQPLWIGNFSLHGKAIFIHAEQGFGDTIQFCRYVPMVAKLGATVILEVPQSLKSLLHNLQGVSMIITTGQEIPDFDCHCPLLSLPLAFQTTLESIPPIAPFYIESSKISFWREKLGVKTLHRIGIVWSGSSEHRNDSNRSIPLSDLIKYLPMGFNYISLQKDIRSTDAETLRTYHQVIHFGDKITDFSDTAALCTSMDLVITVDTSVAHLAASLGKPTWILLPYAPDWRWLSEGSTSPWYPSIQLYRQDASCVWEPVLAQISHDLRIHDNFR